MQDSTPVSRAEYDALRAQVYSLENLLKEYLQKERETAIMTFSQIEDALKMGRTKEKRIRYGGD
jgi:hypothetical protein